MKTTNTLSIVIAGITCGAVLVSCMAIVHEARGKPVDPIETIDVTGTWDVLVTTVTERSDTPAGSQQTAIVTFAQSGSTASGTFTTAKGLGGQVVGTVSSQAVIFAIAQGKPCPGAFAGQGTIAPSGQEMDGWFSGFDCGGNLQQRFVGKRR